MQSSAMLSSGGPVHGINSNQPPLSTSQMALLNQLQDRAQGQSLEQLEHQGQAGMDEMLEQIFAMQPWVEAGGLARANWDYSAAQTSGGGIESMLSLQGGAKQFNVPSMSQEILENAQALASAQFRDREEGTGVDSASMTEGSCYSADGSTLLRQNGTPLHDNRKSCPLPSETVSPDKSAQLQLNPKTVPQNSVTETSASGRGRQSPPPIVTPWHQPYAENAAPSLPLNLVPSLRTDATPTEAQLLGKRIRNEEAVPNSVQDGLQGSLFNTLAGLQTQIGKLTDQHSQPSQGAKSTQGVSSQAYGGQTSVSQQSTGTNSNSAGGSRPRVRARRGQATDPHSIAERLRRERIAERMKALQELVPNSNKTDKASMLDEIIDYVKFLQLQVKVLSMSRLGSAGAVSSMVADLPAEEGISLTEKQVARLMEEDMGTAMQYLQSKGLCLMPIHLASSISSNNVKPQTANQNTEKNESQSTIVMPNNGSLGPAAISGPFTSERNGSENTKLTNMLSRTAKDSEEGKPALSGSKATDETQKRLQ